MGSKLLIFDLDDTLFPRLPDNHTPEQLRSIKLFPQVREILSQPGLKRVLVSKGDPLLQYEKLKALGIKDCFDLILISSTDQEKKSCFEQALKTFPADNTFIIGDRINSEIMFGNELGLITVLLRQGKYRDLVPANPWQIPHYIIHSYAELEEIIGASCKQ